MPDTNTQLLDDCNDTKNGTIEYRTCEQNRNFVWLTHVQFSHISRLSGGSAGIPSISCHASCSERRLQSVSETIIDRTCYSNNRKYQKFKIERIGSFECTHSTVSVCVADII